jgi:VWFA-related protein
MTGLIRRTACLCALTCAAATTFARGQAPPDAQRPVFRGGADVVDVDVSVQDGSRVISGLTIGDFVVLDNGVRQKLDLVNVSAMPLDLTVVADVSGLTGGAWTTNLSKEDLLRQIDDKLRAMAAILRSGDRVEAIVSDTYVRQVLPWRSKDEIDAPAGVASPTFMTTAEAQGLSSTYDALVTAMLQPVPLGRRHVVMAWTKPIDTVSTTDDARLKSIAYQSDAVLHIVLRSSGTTKTPNQSSPSGMSAPGSGDGEGNSGGGSGLATGFGKIGEFSHQGFAHTWKPFARRDPDVLSAAASLTGGTFQAEGVLRDADVAASFKDIFDAYRQGYVVRYTPAGVKPEGWHDIVVRVPRYPKATIRARHGYAVESAPARTAADGPAVPRRTTRTRATEATEPAGAAALTLDGYVALFNRGNDALLQSRLRQARNLRDLIRDYRTAANPWPSQPGLEATFVLEMAAAGFLSRDSGTRQDARMLLEARRDLVRAPLSVALERPLDANAFECHWYEVALATLQGSAQSLAVIELAPDMMARCPSNGRLRLAVAIASDQVWYDRHERPWQGDSAPPGGVATADDVMARYAAAMVFPDVEAEARLRSAWVVYGAADYARALGVIDGRVTPIDDPVVLYFRHLVRAQILRKLDRGEEALADYRRAMDAFPGAQSARVGLLTLSIERGDRAAAEQVAVAIETAPPDAIDPWWVYRQGDYRSFFANLADLRRLATRP